MGSLHPVGCDTPGLMTGEGILVNTTWLGPASEKHNLLNKNLWLRNIFTTT
jgi:hypothetical protein